MKSLPIDTTALRFLAAGDVGPVTDPKTGQHKANASGEPLFAIDLLVQREGRRASVIAVKVAGVAPKVTEGQRVGVTGLEAFAWENDSGHGITFSATKIEVVPASGKAAA